jgi:hypothetical protein
MRPTIFKDWIYEHAQYRAALDRLNGEVLRALEGGSPFILPLLGDSRAGKSALLDDVKSHYAKTVSESGHPRVLLISMPSAASTEALASEIIRAILGPVPIKGRTSDILQQAKDAMVRAGVVVLLIDEVNHLVEKRTTQKAQTKGNRNAADWLKELYDQCGISTIIGGLPHVGRLYFDNDQLENRGLRPIRIEPYAWSCSTDQQEFRATIEAGIEHLQDHGWTLDVELDQLTRILYLGGGGYVGKARDFLARMDETGRSRKRLDAALTSRVFKDKYGFDAKGDPMQLKTIDDVMLNGAYRAALERALRSGKSAK